MRSVRNEIPGAIVGALAAAALVLFLSVGFLLAQTIESGVVPSASAASPKQ